MRKVNREEGSQITGGRWKCTVCGEKFFFHNRAGYHKMVTGHKIKWCW